MNCPLCGLQAVKNGTDTLKDGTVVQTYLCRPCKKRFSERTGTPMSYLRTPAETVALAVKMR